VQDYDIVAWFGAFAPAGTPRPVVDRLHKALSSAAQDKVLSDRLLTAGIEPAHSTPEELAGHVVAEIGKWAEIVKAAGMKPE